MKITMPASKFQRICKDLGIFGEGVKISCTTDSVTFNLDGDFVSGVTTVNHTPNDNIIIELRESIAPIGFALKYLINFAKATPLSPQVILSISPDAPMVVEFVLLDGIGVDCGHIRYYLAPKIDA